MPELRSIPFLRSVSAMLAAGVALLAWRVTGLGASGGARNEGDLACQFDQTRRGGSRSRVSAPDVSR
jgi:hypothetical protein